MADTGVIAAAADEVEPSPDAGKAADPAAVTANGTGSEAAAARARTAQRWFLVILALVVAIVVGVGVRAAADGWLPLGDDGFFALRAHDVFSKHPPLVGTASSASTFSGAPTSHPGPLQFALLAVPVALLGVDAGTVVGTALINAAAIACAAWLLRRRMGVVAGAAAAVCFAGLAWAMGSVLLYDVWGPFAVVVPFALFVVAVGLAAGGDVQALPVVAVAGSMVLQTHVSYVLLVPGLGAVAFGGALWFARRDRAPDVALWRDRGLRWIGAGLAAAVLCWVPPLVQQVRNEPGNMVALYRAAQADSPDTVTAQQGIYLVAGTVALPPWWFPPGFERAAPIYDEVDVDVRNPVANTAMVLFAAVVGVALWSAARRRDRIALAALGTAVAGLGLGYASIMRAPQYGVWAASYTRFLWPLSLWVWFSIGLTAARAWAARRAKAQADAPVDADADADAPAPRVWTRRIERGLLPAMAVLVVLIAVGAVPHRDNIPADRDSWQLTGPPLVDAVLDRVDDLDGPVVFKEVVSQASYTYAPMLMAEMAEQDVAFLVDGDAVIRQVGGHRGATPGSRPVAELWILSSADPAFDGELIYTGTGLRPSREAEIEKVSAEIDEEIAAHESLRLSAEAEAYIMENLPDHMGVVQEKLATRPITADILRQLDAFAFHRPLLWEDGEPLDRELVDRWGQLELDREYSRAVVYLRMLPGA